MTDLRERLRQIERNPSPDLWEEITDRDVGSVPRTATQHGWRRVAIIAVSLAIGLAAVAWVVVAIRPESRPPSIGSVPAGTSRIDIAPAADGSLSATWTYGDEVLLGVPAEVLGPGPTSVDGAGNQGSPKPGTVTEFLGVEGFSIDYGALGAVEPPAMSIPADVPIASGEEMALLAFRAGEGQGAGYVEWGEMTALRTPTDLRRLENGGRYRIVVVARGTDDAPLQFVFDIDVKPQASATDTTTTETAPVHIDGVPFDVCRPMSIPGKFIGGFDTLWVFERAPKQGCEGYEGFQYLGVGTSDTVAGLSNAIHDVGQNTTSLWPYAAFDIDHDGVDEIAVGIGGSEPHRRVSIVPFRVGFLPGASDRLGIEQVRMSQGSLYVQPWIDLGNHPNAHLGAECEPYGSLKRGIVLWSVDSGTDRDPQLDARLWTLDGSELQATTETFQLQGEATASLPDGTIELCGSPVHWPSEFPNYPAEDIVP